MPDASPFLAPLLDLHDRIRASVVEACESQSTAALSEVAADEAGDTIYRIDKVSEELLVEGLSRLAASEPLVLIAEGMPEGGVPLPEGTPPEECRWRVIVDPIDGTRGIMYQKRSAWVLTGVAPNRGGDTRLRDVVLAVQTEIPLVKQHLCDQLHAFRGSGVVAVRHDRVRADTRPLPLHPSRSDTIEHGFSTVARFFPGARDELAAIDDEIVAEVLGPPSAGKAGCFEDQYACTGGQLYELMTGHDRFIADVRPLMAGVRARRGLPRGLCCHPYDLCTALIAEELGVVVTDPSGAPLDMPLDLETDVSWVGYANERIRRRVEPALQAALRRRGLVGAGS
jgi:fructose-1,6-bisphosphatase/inositol monophosphatase family enzyme